MPILDAILLELSKKLLFLYWYVFCCTVLFITAKRRRDCVLRDFSTHRSLNDLTRPPDDKLKTYTLGGCR